MHVIHTLSSYPFLYQWVILNAGELWFSTDIENYIHHKYFLHIVYYEDFF